MTLADESPEMPAAEDLRVYADRLTNLADELEWIEEEATADEITYQIRDGEVAVIELAYYLADRDTDRD